MATIKDIAKRANVSVSTVSSVINNSAFVSEPLRQKILQTIEELNYRPNVIARSLKKNLTRTIGLLISDILNPFYPAVVRGAEDALMESGYTVFLCCSASDHDRENAYLETLLERRVDGLLIMTAHLNDTKFSHSLFNDLRVVLINRHPSEYKGPYVGVDNHKIGSLAAQHLLSLGHKRIGYVSGPGYSLASINRELGFREKLQREGISLEAECVGQGDYSIESGYAFGKKVAAMNNTQRPEAIFCANDLMAFGLIRALREDGIAVPSDISVIGCDNIQFSEDFVVPLTTIEIPKYEMGYRAAELLLEQINNSEVEFQQIILNPFLIERKSTAYREGIHL